VTDGKKIEESFFFLFFLRESWKHVVMISDWCTSLVEESCSTGQSPQWAVVPVEEEYTVF
jgi:hypothetical protein